MHASIEKIRADYETVMNRIKTIHIKAFPGLPEPLFLISNTYPGVWLEHAYDGIVCKQEKEWTAGGVQEPAVVSLGEGDVTCSELVQQTHYGIIVRGIVRCGTEDGKIIHRR